MPSEFEDPKDLLKDVHAKYEAFVAAWESLVQQAGQQEPGRSRFTASVDAYQPFVRDQGMGDDPYAWMQSAADEFDLDLEFGGPEDYPDKSILTDVVDRPMETEDEEWLRRTQTEAPGFYGSESAEAIRFNRAEAEGVADA